MPHMIPEFPTPANSSDRMIKSPEILRCMRQETIVSCRIMGPARSIFKMERFDSFRAQQTRYFRGFAIMESQIGKQTR
jgi:hypothetical protein